MNLQTLLGKILVSAIVVMVGAVIFSQATATFAQTEPQNGDAGGFVICGNEADNPCKIGDLFTGRQVCCEEDKVKLQPHRTKFSVS